jgi:hypothetical protein
VFDSRGLRSSRAAFRDGPAVPEATWPRNGCADDAGFLAMNSLLTSRRSNKGSCSGAQALHSRRVGNNGGSPHSAG